MTWRERIGEWIAKAVGAPPLPTVRGGWGGWQDSWRAISAPSDERLISAWSDVAYACATINAEAVADGVLRLYARTTPARRRKSLGRDDQPAEEVCDHPLIDLLSSPARDVDGVSRLSRHDLFALTQLYLEVCGRAYWLLERNALGTPANVWLLPSHLVTPYRAVGSPRIVDYYQYTADGALRQYEPRDVVVFAAPDLRDPYTGGRSPLHAAWGRVQVAQAHLSHQYASLHNQARPDAIISPAGSDGVLGMEEARRLEQEFTSRFARGGAGGVWVSQDALKVEPIGWQPRDVALLAESDATTRMIARCFGVPLALLDNDSNRANAEAGRRQHAQSAVRPRMARIASTITSQLLTQYDPAGRLHVEYDDPVQADRAALVAEWTALVAAQILTVNEVRAADGLPPVEWGDGPAPQPPQLTSPKASPDDEDDEEGDAPPTPDDPDDEEPAAKSYKGWWT